MNEARVVAENLDIVHAIARRLSSAEADIEDLEQEGAIALLLAARAWRADGGASLRTFAGSAIKVAMFKHMCREKRAGLSGKRGRVGNASASLPRPTSCSMDMPDSKEVTLHDRVSNDAPSPETLCLLLERAIRVRAIVGASFKRAA